MAAPSASTSTTAHSSSSTAPPTAILRKHVNDRLFEHDPTLTRLDITSSTLSEFTSWELFDFPKLLPRAHFVTHVHLSGDDLEDTLTNEQIDNLLTAISSLPNLQELFCFRGNNCEILTEQRLAKLLKELVSSNTLTVLMLWGFSALHQEPTLAGAIRQQEALQRVTLTLPDRVPYASMDIYGMGLASMPNLQCLSIRGSPNLQTEAIMSPEALTLLMGSRSIQSLYLESCALVDDHSDVMAQELAKHNKTLKLLDLKHNHLSDDALYAFAICLKTNKTLKSLDLSGVEITEAGVDALADALHVNTTITNLELEGQLSRFQDEFDIPEGHSNTSYMQALHYELRLNRAGSDESRPLFVEALNLVSDHLGCLYHLVRKNPSYCNRQLMMVRQHRGRHGIPKQIQKMITPAEAQEAPELSEPVKRMFESYAMH